jgi:beta-galactosidase
MSMMSPYAYRDGEEWSSAITQTTGPTTEIELAADRSNISADGYGLAFITARMVDGHGRTVPEANNLVSFSIDGPGEAVVETTTD